MMGQNKVSKTGGGRKKTGPLERTNDPFSSDRIRSQTDQAFPAESDIPLCRFYKSGNNIEKGRFPRPIRPDDPQDFPFLNLDIDQAQGP